jgi:ferredoxin-NADP reductase
LRLKVLQLRWEAEDVVSVELISADDRPLPPWAPGDHIDVHLPGGLIRQYSLCGDSRHGAPWRIAVLRVRDGRGGSAAVHDTVRPGDVLTVVGPRNNFGFRAAGSYIFLAGGIGITPILPMVRQAEAGGTPWQLWYGGRSRSNMALVEELAAIESSADLDRPERLRLIAQDEHGLLPLQQILGNAQSDTLVYCCGPAPMLDAVTQACAHWQPDSLVIERFSAKEQPHEDNPGSGFEVEAARSGLTVTVAPQESIVEALEAAGVEPMTSCLEGICGTCETKVLSGVPDHRDSLLSESEREANQTMMICVSRCAGSRLVLDI